jgi:3-methylcrotonyl-CoA carboxylase alpha subunit
MYEFKLEDAKYEKELGTGSVDASDVNSALAPMPGVVDRINVKVGDRIKKGDPLVVMIAMKMEYVIRANRDGQVKLLNCTVGQNVKKAHHLVTLCD